MNIKNIFSVLFDAVFFFITATACIFAFYFVSDELAKDSSYPILFGLLSAVASLVLMYFIYSVIDK